MTPRPLTAGLVDDPREWWTRVITRLLIESGQTQRAFARSIGVSDDCVGQWRLLGKIPRNAAAVGEHLERATGLAGLKAALVEARRIAQVNRSKLLSVRVQRTLAGRSKYQRRDDAADVE